MEVLAYAPWGYDGELVRVEVDVRRGIPAMDIVGLPGGAVREARERIRIALRRAGFEYPQDRILFNLSPADLPKHGGGFDLPLALALLAATGQWRPPFETVLAMGELSLTGGIKRSPGALAALQRAEEALADAVYLPAENAEEVAGTTSNRCFLARDLASLVAGDCDAPRHTDSTLASCEDGGEVDWPLRGHPELTLPLEVCAAGGHSILLFGPPGTGKTLTARSFESLLPPLSELASRETLRIWSLAGLSRREGGSFRSRPFLTPHHSSSVEGLLGGGRMLSPGEVSLAHQGVLFLDEAPEFSSRVLQSLREPLETGSLSLARAGRTAWFPSRFQLLMTANACPCGQTGSDQGLCSCSAQEVRRYWDRIGTPLMDRIDVRVFLKPAPAERLLDKSKHTEIPSRQRIMTAWRRQRERFPGRDRSNATLSPDEIRQYCVLPESARGRFSQTMDRQGWSSRAAHSLLKIARTIADLDDRESLEQTDLEQALVLRRSSSEAYWEL